MYLAVLDFGLFGCDVGFRSRSTELLNCGGVSRVGIVDVGHHRLEIRIEGLDDGVGLHCLSIVCLHFRELLAGFFGERVDVFLTRHVVIGNGVLTDDDLDVLELVGLLVLCHARGAVDHGVVARRRGAGVVAVRVHGEGCNLFASAVESDGTAGLGRARGIGHMAVNLACRPNIGGRSGLRGSLGKREGQRGKRQQSEQSGPERNRSFHVLLLGSLGEPSSPHARSKKFQ